MNEEQTVIHKRVPVAGAPTERNAYLIVLSGRAVGKMYKLGPGEHVVGRSTDADIRLDDEGISRSHAMLRRRADGTVEVSDLDSTNGTFVDGARVTTPTTVPAGVPVMAATWRFAEAAGP